jgi:transposase, IS30 family
MGSYNRVTLEDRIKIKVLLQQGKCPAEIAREVDKHRSTITRELKRNSGGRGYRVKQAQRMAETREMAKHRPYRMTEELKSTVGKLLNRKWSPEQISKRLAKEERPTASAETIYKHVYEDLKDGGELWRHLRRSHRRRKSRFSSQNRRGVIKNATPIHERPRSADRRKKKGHWERDTMLGLDRKTGILALVDRKTRFNKFIKLNRRTAPKVTAATVKALKGLPLKSITNDRGLEFAGHQKCSKKLGVKIYFCDPYSSHQRGTNENRIGILRQYFPKKSCLKKVTRGQIRKIEFEINNRPMKCLDWKTPYEAMMGVTVALGNCS